MKYVIHVKNRGWVAECFTITDKIAKVHRYKTQAAAESVVLEMSYIKEQLCILEVTDEDNGG